MQSGRSFEQNSLLQRNISRQALVDELVIQDRCSKLKFGLFCLASFHADNTALAENFAVLLPRDRFWHFEYHFHQSIFRKTLLTSDEHARLAQVFDGALVPCPQVFHAIAKRSIHFDTARSWHPVRS